MRNAHQRLPDPTGPASTTRDASEFHGMEFCLPTFSGREPVALPQHQGEAMYTLAHLHVICRDMEKMIRFWREALGAEFVEYRTFGDDPGAIMRFGGLEIYFKEIPQAKELQSGQVGYEHVGVYVPHLETSVESLVKGFGCTLASMPANQNRVAFVRGPENLMLELIEA